MRRLTILITAGPTQEPIDPVRYLSNRSSGKMGYALAEAAQKRGHRVILISGPVSLSCPARVKLILVTTALDMYKEVMKHFRASDVIIKTAAVADWRPARFSGKKIKKGQKTLNLKLIPNPDILKRVGKIKGKNQLLVGFAAETDRPLFHAQQKLLQKKCDWIVLNDVSQKGIGFESDQNQVTLLSRGGQKINLPRMSKKKLAKKILEVIL